MSFCEVSLPEQVGEDGQDERLIGRRAAARLPVRVPARFRLGEVVVDLMVTDISGTGARLHMPSPPPRGSEGILIWQGMDCPCRIAWSAKDSFGVAFTAAAPALQELSRQARVAKPRAAVVVPFPDGAEQQAWINRRSPPRPLIERRAEIRQAEGWVKVVLKDISQHGFAIGWFPRCKEQAPISLRGPGLPLLHGRVVASDQVVVRCKLREPLHEAVLNHISAQLGIGG